MESLKRGEICCEKISSGQQDYHSDKNGSKEKIWNIILTIGVILGLAYFFYRSLWAVPALGGIGYLFFLDLERKRSQRKREELTSQFKDCILTVSTLLQAGYSIENAFFECESDMNTMHGKNAGISHELKLIRRGLHINISLEELLSDMGKRSHCGEIEEFAEMFAIAKRNGGNISEIIQNAAHLISHKIELKNEINTTLAGKKMELLIMKGMPFMILLYVEITNPGYFDCFYHNLRGIILMTLGLMIYLGAYLLSEFVMYKLEEQML